MRKVRRKKITPRLCSLGSTVWEQEKHLSTQKHIHHRHTTCNRGSNPAPASSHPDPQPLFRRWSQTRLSGWWIQSVKGEGQERLTAVFFPRDEFPTATLARASAGTGEPKKIRLRLFRLGASNRIPIPRLLSLSILISNIINFLLQSRELLHDRIHIAVNSLSLNVDRSSHCFSHNGQPCEALDSCSRFLNSSITQGKA